MQNDQFRGSAVMFSVSTKEMFANYCAGSISRSSLPSSAMTFCPLSTIVFPSSSVVEAWVSTYGYASTTTPLTTLGLFDPYPAACNSSDV